MAGCYRQHRHPGRLASPALSRAKQSTYQAVCASNMRQVALAWNFYTVDNEDYQVTPARSNHIDTPWTRRTYHLGPNVIWHEILSKDYMGLNTNVWEYPANRNVNKDFQTLLRERPYMDDMIARMRKTFGFSYGLNHAGYQYMPSAEKWRGMPEPAKLFPEQPSITIMRKG